MFRLALTIVCALLCSMAIAAPAQAANTKDTQIYNDAKDGSIDGKYTLAELRHADSNISADQREYFLWEEMYAAAIAAASNPNAPKPPKLQIIPPRDENGNGTIDQAEIASAAAKTKAANAKKLADFDKKKDVVSENQNAGDDAEAEPVAAKEDGDEADDGDGANWPLIVLVLAVLLIAGVGTWRVIANGKEAAKQPKDDSASRKGPKNGPGGRK